MGLTVMTFKFDDDFPAFNFHGSWDLTILSTLVSTAQKQKHRVMALQQRLICIYRHFRYLRVLEYFYYYYEINIWGHSKRCVDIFLSFSESTQAACQ